jgi:hypothetical protein
MFIARWTITAKFGHKDAALALCAKWHKEVGAQAGFKKTRVLTGSIGACESRIDIENEFASLADVEKAWSEMSKNPWHQQFGKELEPHVVSGTNHWEVLRVVEGG